MLRGGNGWERDQTRCNRPGESTCLWMSMIWARRETQTPIIRAREWQCARLRIWRCAREFQQSTMLMLNCVGDGSVIRGLLLWHNHRIQLSSSIWRSTWWCPKQLPWRRQFFVFDCQSSHLSRRGCDFSHSCTGSCSSHVFLNLRLLRGMSKGG